MSIEVVTSWQTLIHYARELAEAKKRGDPVEIAKAAAAHDVYRNLVLDSDRTVTGWTVGDLGAR
jgi:hypothetical protein